MPTFWTTLELTYDLQAGRYLALGLDNEEPRRPSTSREAHGRRLQAGRAATARHPLAQSRQAGRARLAVRTLAVAPAGIVPRTDAALLRIPRAHAAGRSSRRSRSSRCCSTSPVAGKRLVAVGERGHVLLSDDQGKTWRQAQSARERER